MSRYVTTRPCGCVRYWTPDKATTLFCPPCQDRRARMRRAGMRPATDPYKPMTTWPKVKPRPRWKAWAIRAWKKLARKTA